MATLVLLCGLALATVVGISYCASRLALESATAPGAAPTTPAVAPDESVSLPAGAPPTRLAEPVTTTLNVYNTVDLGPAVEPKPTAEPRPTRRPTPRAVERPAAAPPSRAKTLLAKAPIDDNPY